MHSIDNFCTRRQLFPKIMQTKQKEHVRKCFFDFQRKPKLLSKPLTLLFSELIMSIFKTKPKTIFCAPSEYFPSHLIIFFISSSLISISHINLSFETRRNADAKGTILTISKVSKSKANKIISSFSFI